MNFALNSFHQPPILRGKTIFLRAALATDFTRIKEYRHDPENCRYIGPIEDEAKTKALVEQLCKPWELSENIWNGLVICDQHSGNVIGEIVFRIEDSENQRAEIGYRISPHVHNQGVCSQAGQLFIHYLFSELGFYKLVAKCDPRNTASFKVMEKLGFVREAFFKGHYLLGDEWTDQYDYGLINPYS